MKHVDHLIVGAGISGLSFANALEGEAQRRGKGRPDWLLIEADTEPGGYCKTVREHGFVWDYSGHFFHFKHKEIERWLCERMPDGQVVTVNKRTYIRFGGRDIDFPFQKNIHQLPHEDFLDCLYELYFRDEGRPAGQPANFKEMLYRKFGRGIADRFLVPYNEKLYACDVKELDVDAMGRFFPQADIADIIRNMRKPDNASYNSTFTYPRGGAIEYVRALLRDLPADRILYDEALVEIDLSRRIARTTRREIHYDKLTTSAPLQKTLKMAKLAFDAAAFTYNRVLVYNLGFDKKSETDAHWMYFPDGSLPFYRVGFYDNILGADRMSLYVEVGLPGAEREAVDVQAMQASVLAGLAREGIVRDHKLVAAHHVIMDPAYVHITRASLAELQRLRPVLAAGGVYPVGRYGGWTYCAIEDNIVETRALAAVFGELL